MPKPRTLCLDLGLKRVGLAISDELGITAQGLPTLAIRSLEHLLQELAPIIKEYSVADIVLGLPKRLDGSDTDLTGFVVKAKEAIDQRFGLPVRLYDERLTSRMAQQAVHDMGHKLKGRKQVLDRIAATIILTDYLSQHGKKEA